MYGDALAPVNRLANFVTRNWTDGNRNFVPDCDLTNPADQNFLPVGGDRCFAMSDLNFGKPTPSVTVDPAVMNGFGVRPYNWEFSAGVQRQVASRMSVEFAYFRRWFGNFAATDNRALAASDFSPFSVTAPVDSRLPGGGGVVTSGSPRSEQDRRRPDNYFTAAGNYGSQIQHWNGFDLTANVRPRQGVLLQGGFSTGKTLTDNCEILAKLPEISQLGVPYCHQETPFLTQMKLFGAYTVPKVDVQISGAFQSIPGPQLAANQVMPNAQIKPSLGRDLIGGAANVTVNLVPPGSMFGDRLNQLDLRFAKILRFGQHADVAQPRPLQRLQRQHRAGGELDLLERLDHRLARADDDRDGALREDQRPVRFLSHVRATEAQSAQRIFFLRRRSSVPLCGYVRDQTVAARGWISASNARSGCIVNAIEAPSSSSPSDPMNGSCQFPVQSTM